MDAKPIEPDSPQAYLALGDRYRACNRLADALACYESAIALAPGSAAAFSRRGGVLLKQRRYDEASASCIKAVALDPGSVEAWAALGRVFGKLRQYDLAIGAYRRARAIAPDHPFLKGRLLQYMVTCCDWQGVAPLVDEIALDIDAGRLSARPFVWQAVSSSPYSLLRCAERFNGDDRQAANVPASPTSRADAKLRIGYVSGEFRDHSRGYLTVGVFEHHDKDRFEVVAFDNGWDDGGATRARINRAVAHIVDIRGLSDNDAAAAVAAARIDILVDLNGFYGLQRTNVFARRPAPVQITFPGYPGTLGADYIDYMIADHVVVPDGDAEYYTEKIVRLPHSYQANDRLKPIADVTFRRESMGLPENGIVFCCFNNNYKITEITFDSWATILRAVPGSVLWLLADNPVAVANLRKAAEARSIDPARLVFAERMAMPEHLARHACADLFLDTLPYNAHTTASDALWSGLPLVTCLGSTFSGRVAASLLHAIGLPDLIADTRADFECKAIRLASDPSALDDVRRRLAQNRLTMPLFDTERYTRHLETAYLAMHARFHAGLPPDHITVADWATA